MRSKELPIDIVNSLSNRIPMEALMDINKRMTDWMASGGNDTDEYMWQQARYAQRWSNRLKSIS
ncbi:DUF6877 family protein [Companilactobacillus bobalius]|uniref:DUF6877 domain-containing protein n=2 Tax=Companilactobacillus bobalius TaxID=2801451 RepID=A0A202F7U0_9LACO|nr:DUF6877 family protein [Companilactobacillus bobalius]GEO58500.1 hypothetical protein LBO01_16290 [Companilactobacillus paralimentarius]KAE9557555.1 hypothetical protein ATN92_15485 [Companilactobacillus bobalius]KAE9563701.1 hypothetical protein ATN92_02935 [Companilactobacillus bobalius]KRK83445.1 hypothetical protein FC78_GL001401 [Companilactobacillus bobalius DSM 19674]OVE96525.1 hypothetical protein LKACC16343_02192 [Companilactobacillus bobalius]